MHMMAIRTFPPSIGHTDGNFTKNNGTRNEKKKKLKEKRDNRESEARHMSTKKVCQKKRKLKMDKSWMKEIESAIEVLIFRETKVEEETTYSTIKYKSVFYKSIKVNQLISLFIKN